MVHTQTDHPRLSSARPEITQAIMDSTGLDQAMLTDLVHSFYGKIRADAVLGPIFASRISDWPPHLERMLSFWSSVALMTGSYHGASPPCLACEIAQDYFDPLAVDPEQARDVGRWRKIERARLRADRQALSVEDRASVGAALTGHLLALFSARYDTLHGMVFSAYWPIKGEPDLRPLMAKLHAVGVTVCLPIVEQKAAPLVFRRWTPTTRMVRGDWNIPVPPPDAAILTPDISLAPLIGWDPYGYRLGYGGGYFDRTLAALDPQPFCIGVGFQSARLATIFPQPHDIQLDVILTEAGIQVQRESS